MYNSNNNKQLTKSNPLRLGSHEKPHLLFPLTPNLMLGGILLIL